MTSREFNRAYKNNGISLEYIGYTLHRTSKSRTWILHHGNNTEWVYSIDEANDMAEKFIKWGE